MNADRIAEVYYGEVGSPTTQRQARRRIHWMCAAARGQSILDVGCSQGIAALLLAREGRTVMAVDREQVAIDYARDLLVHEEQMVRDRVTFRLAEAASLPFEDGAFDSALVGEVIEHLVDPVPVLDEVARCLRPGGMLVLTTPYGIFPYHDHKEPVYLEGLLELLEARFSVEHAELVGAYLAVVATSTTGQPYDRRAALRVAEERLREQDSAVETHRMAAKRESTAPAAPAVPAAPERVAELERALAERDDRIARLEADLEHLREVAALHDGVAEAFERRSAEATMRARALAEALGAGEASRAEAEALRDQLERAQERLREHERELEERRSELAGRRSSERALRTRIARLESAPAPARPEAPSGNGVATAPMAKRATAPAAVPPSRPTPSTPPRPAAAASGSAPLTLAAARAAAAERPDDATAWLDLARALGRTKQHAEAADAALRAVAADPDGLDSLWEAGEALARLPADGRFVGVMDRLGPLPGLDDDSLVRMRDLSLRGSDHARVLAAAGEASRRGASDSAWVGATAIAHWELGADEDAEALVAPLLAEGAADGDLAAAARYLLHAGALDRALAALERMTAPDRTQLAEAARQLMHAGRFTESLATLDAVLAQAASFGYARRLRATAASTHEVVEDRWAPAAPRQPLDRVRGRVLHLLQRTFPHHQAGSSVRTHAIGRAQLAAGLDVHAVTQPGFPWNAGVADGAELDVIDGVSYHRLRDPGTGSGLAERLRDYVEALAPLVEELRPAVLHPHSMFVNALVALELGERYDIPVVYEVRGFPEERVIPQTGTRRLIDTYVTARTLERRACLRAAHVVTLADVMRRHLGERGIDTGRVTIVPNAVDPDNFQPVPRDAEVAARLGLDDDTMVVGYISTFAPYDGIQYLLQAVALLRADGRRVHCLLVGDGAQRGFLERTAAQLEIEGDVTFTGMVPHADVRRYYSLIDAFVVPRTNEAVSNLVTPLKPYEAMALQRTLVVSGTVALREMVEDGHTGVCFRPEDPEDLAAKLADLIDDPARRAELAAAARTWVLANRTWEANAQRYLEIYRRMDAL